jgi:hypothetical protein
MKIVTIGCEHNASQIKLRIPAGNLCCIQCGLIQVILSLSQAAKIRRHCHCMKAQLYFGRLNDKPCSFITVDPSLVDLRGEIMTWSIG